MNIPKQLKKKISKSCDGSTGRLSSEISINLRQNGYMDGAAESFHLTTEYILGLLESEEAVNLMKHPGNISEIAGATLMSGKKWAEFIREKIEKDGKE